MVAPRRKLSLFLQPAIASRDATRRRAEFHEIAVFRRICSWHGDSSTRCSFRKSPFVGVHLFVDLNFTLEPLLVSDCSTCNRSAIRLPIRKGSAATSSRNSPPDRGFATTSPSVPRWGPSYRALISSVPIPIVVCLNSIHHSNAPRRTLIVALIGPSALMFLRFVDDGKLLNQLAKLVRCRTHPRGFDLLYR